MKVSEAFPSNYLKADDLQGRNVTVEIESCAMEEVGDDRRLVLRFKNKGKSLVANKTNALAISDAYGEEIDNWPGNRITLFPTRTMYGGKNVPCIRVTIPAGNLAAALLARPTPAALPPSQVAENADGSVADEDAIPF